MSVSGRAHDAAAREALTFEHGPDGFVARFHAMGGPCEVLIDTDDRAEARVVAESAAGEARRVERKFSRYRSDNIVHAIHQAGGQPVHVDEETAHLIDYAVQCYEVSEGKFDITSGILRKAWTFDGGDRIPSDEAVREVLKHVGWHRVTWSDSVLTMPAGMEIDLGGIGKEYAVDRAAALCSTHGASAILVNFGGDLLATGPRREGRPWRVGVDDPERTGEAARFHLELDRGALATSGDARRFVRWNGKRLGHILDPSTGWPVRDAPRSVTVLAATCIEAGTLATLACLQGPAARDFLERQGIRYWIA
jgi:thiamine biosynthesis lipoprotein